jgi:hypothetical protein
MQKEWRQAGLIGHRRFGIAIMTDDGLGWRDGASPRAIDQ